MYTIKYTYIFIYSFICVDRFDKFNFIIDVFIEFVVSKKKSFRKAFRKACRKAFPVRITFRNIFRKANESSHRLPPRHQSCPKLFGELWGAAGEGLAIDQLDLRKNNEWMNK